MSRGLESRTPAPVITVLFDHPERRYEPGDLVTVRYRIDGLGDESVRAVEHSLLWYTEGKGEEDLGVQFFERVEAVVRSGGDMVAFAAHLPASPLSYEGVIVKIRWCARIRVFFRTARDFVSEHVFEVGGLPPARAVAAESP